MDHPDLDHGFPRRQCPIPIRQCPRRGKPDHAKMSSSDSFSPQQISPNVPMFKSPTPALRKHSIPSIDFSTHEERAPKRPRLVLISSVENNATPQPDSPPIPQPAQPNPGQLPVCRAPVHPDHLRCLDIENQLAAKEKFLNDMVVDTAVAEMISWVVTRAAPVLSAACFPYPLQLLPSGTRVSGPS